MRKPAAVLQDIDKCDAILSSSLHGLVCADSLNIPNGWLSLSDKVFGKGFKFRDHFSATEIFHNPLHVDGSESLSQLINHTIQPSSKIEEIKESLDHTFKAFRSSLNNQ
jgi:pyruvyltransferase